MSKAKRLLSEAAGNDKTEQEINVLVNNLFEDFGVELYSKTSAEVKSVGSYCQEILKRMVKIKMDMLPDAPEE